MTPESHMTDKPLAEVTEADIKVAAFQTLRRWSIAAGLGGSGKAADLRRRLVVKISGTTEKHSHGKTLCKICLAPAKVVVTKRQPMDDGRTLVTRSMRCEDKHHHTYPLKNIEGVIK